LRPTLVVAAPQEAPPPPQLPPRSVPLQIQMRAFVDVAGACCTTCGSSLILVRGRRDVGGEGMPTIRCSLFLARDTDGQRVCRQRVDPQTVVAWYEAGVRTGRLLPLPQPPHAATPPAASHSSFQ
jgi:hypothetical protein